MLVILYSNLRTYITLACLLALASSLVGCLPNRESTKSKSTLDSYCLMHQEACKWQDLSSPGLLWEVNIEQETNNRLFKLTVVAPKSFQEDSLTLTWRGLDMYLGVYPRRLNYQKSTSEGRLYTKQMSLPLCSLDPLMSWQLQLSSGSTLIETPFKLVYSRPQPQR